MPPSDWTGNGNGVDKYDYGLVWSAALIDIYLNLGKTKTDRIVLQSHFLMAADTDFSGGAAATIYAAYLLYGGQSVEYDVVQQAFSDRGITTTAYMDIYQIMKILNRL